MDIVDVFPLAASHHANLVYLPITTTTQDDMRRYLPGTNFFSLIANEQTSGRGRLGRKWDAPAGTSLLVSTLIHLPNTPLVQQNIGWITIIGALSVRASVAAVVNEYSATAGSVPTASVPTGSAPATAPQTNPEIYVKWPNDVYVSDLKMAGVIGELLPGTDDTLMCCLGSGINLTQRIEQLLPTATSLALNFPQLPTEQLRDRVLDKYMYELRSRITAFTDACATPDASEETLAPIIQALCAELNEHLAYRGTKFTQKTAGSQSVTGTIAGVDTAGNLLMNNEHGTCHISPDDVALGIYAEIPDTNLPHNNRTAAATTITDIDPNA